ncbi:hypothetical protein PCE1_003062 [Barthelona sp. PCE]
MSTEDVVNKFAALRVRLDDETDDDDITTDDSAVFISDLDNYSVESNSEMRFTGELYEPKPPNQYVELVPPVFSVSPIFLGQDALEQFNPGFDNKTVDVIFVDARYMGFDDSLDGLSIRPIVDNPIFDPLFANFRTTAEETTWDILNRAFSESLCFGKLSKTFDVSSVTEYSENEDTLSFTSAQGIKIESNWRLINMPIFLQAKHTGSTRRHDLFDQGSLIISRYRILEKLDEGTFSHVFEVEDVRHSDTRVMKVIKDSRKYFQQTLDEISILEFLKNEDVCGIAPLIDFFYYAEYVFLIFERAHKNLYAFQHSYREKYDLVRSSNRFLQPFIDSLYSFYYPFNVSNLKTIARSILTFVSDIHAKDLIHCDLKPENILFATNEYERYFSVDHDILNVYSEFVKDGVLPEPYNGDLSVRIVDFGSATFSTDDLSCYAQSRSYRAPEVICGVDFGPKIDIWSLGCILVELFTGTVLFPNHSTQKIMCQIISLFGPLPDRYLYKGKYISGMFTSEGVLFELTPGSSAGSTSSDGSDIVKLLIPQPVTLRDVMKCDDELFLDFLTGLLQPDDALRFSAKEALEHPFLSM